MRLRVWAICAAVAVLAVACAHPRPSPGDVQLRPGLDLAPAGWSTSVVPAEPAAPPTYHELWSWEVEDLAKPPKHYFGPSWLEFRVREIWC